MPPAAPSQDSIIEKEYRRLCTTPSDINEHLPVLKEYADQCDHVTEFGVRGCVSLHAFLASNAKKVVAYDIANVAVPVCAKLTFINANVLLIKIEPTDLLFIDTLHTYRQLRAELARHSKKVRRYLAFHDTSFYGAFGEDGGPGLLKAIAEFQVNHPEWITEKQLLNNNGLTILKRA